MRNPGSDIMALADFHEISLMPFTTTTHSHTLCTALGGFANDLISVTSFLSRSSRANLAASRAGSASARASSAPFCNHMGGDQVILEDSSRIGPSWRRPQRSIHSQVCDLKKVFKLVFILLSIYLVKKKHCLALPKNSS